MSNTEGPGETTGEPVRVPQKKPRQMRTELDRLLMDEGTVNMLCDRDATTNAGTAKQSSNGNGVNNKKKKLEELDRRRLQVLSTVRNQSGDTVKKLREKKKPEVKPARRRSSEEGYANGNVPKGSPVAWCKGRRASLLATLKEDRNGTGDTNGKGAESIEGPPEQKQILSNVTRDGLGHVTITFQSNGRHTIDLKALRDLTSTLQALGSDPRVKVILVSSSGNSKFCNGLDLRELIGTTDDKKQAAVDIAEAINMYLITLAELPKLTIISLHSSVSNLFVTSLPLFDLIYASDKSTFRCNYLTTLNQVPEGGTLLYEKLGPVAFNNLVYGGKVLTANEAKECGLVSEVLWPARYQEELVNRVNSFLGRKLSNSFPMTKSSIPRLKCLSEQNLKEAKKDLVNSWISEDFQNAARNFVNSRVIRN